MIVPMKKVSLVVLNNERKDALLQLKKVGVVHLEQIDGSSEQLSLYKEASNNAVAANAILSDIKVAKKKSFSSAVKTLSNDEVVAKCKHVIDISDKKKKLFNANLTCGLYSYFGKPPKLEDNKQKINKTDR